MYRLLPLLLLLAACGQPAEDPNSATDPAPAETTTTVDQADLFAELPELAECKEMLMNEPGMLPGGPTWLGRGDPAIIDIPCGPAVGTGAYGYPLALVAEWAPIENTPEGPVPLLRQPIEIVEQAAEGQFESVGYVTTAITSWSESDIANGYIHLLYKYAGAGQCGLLTTYSSEAWRAPFEFREARERSCDAEPCDDGSCYDPMTWELVYSVWDQ